jgi:cellobiose phosphorylase
MYESKWGFLDEAGRRYVITTPETPRMWENYLYSMDGKFHVIISQRAKGETFYDCFVVNTVSYSRNYCIFDKDNKNCWSLNAGDAPIKAESYQCTHSPGRTVFFAEHTGLKTKVSVVVDTESYREVNRVKITNNSNKTRKLSLIGYQEISLKGIDNKLECQWSRFVADANAIVCQRRHYRTPEYQYAVFYHCDSLVNSFCGSKADFLGGDVEFYESQVFKTGVLSNTDAYGTELITALQKNIELDPGQSMEINFTLSLAQNIDDAQQDALAFNKLGDGAYQIFGRVEQFYDQMLGSFPLELPDRTLNIMLNTWSKCQLHRQAISARSTPWFNWRNHLQDSWAYLMFDPTWEKYWIEQTCRATLEDGFMPRCSARIKELEFPDQTHADIATWAALCVERYIAETGDLEFLNKQIEYAENSKQATIVDCILGGLNWLIDHPGPNGMVLMRDGDWSDPLEEVGKRDIGESPWTSMALVNAVRHFNIVLNALGRQSDAEKLKASAQNIKDAVNKYAWDGNWYIRAITDDGERLCTKKDKDGRVSLLLQAWAIISGVADEDRVKKLVKAVDENNKNDHVGPILYAPPFMTPRPWIGRETAKPPGTCVNGSCYNHVAMMWAKAEMIIGRPEAAVDIIKKILPLQELDNTDKSKAIPLWMPNYWHGPHSKTPGLGSDVMTSASPPWMYLVVYDDLLGIKATVDGLLVSPCLPKYWDKIKVQRKWRGSTYNFEYKRKGDGNVISVRMDGKAVTRGLIKPDQSPQEHIVRVTMS